MIQYDMVSIFIVFIAVSIAAAQSTGLYRGYGISPYGSDCFPKPSGVLSPRVVYTPCENCVFYPKFRRRPGAYKAFGTGTIYGTDGSDLYTTRLTKDCGLRSYKYGGYGICGASHCRPRFCRSRSKSYGAKSQTYATAIATAAHESRADVYRAASGTYGLRPGDFTSSCGKLKRYSNQLQAC